MSKNNITDSDLRNFEKELQAQFKLEKDSLEEAYKENSKLFQEFEKKQQKINNMFSNPELDRKLDEDINKMAKEMGIILKEENTFKEFEDQINNMPDNDMPGNQTEFALQRTGTVSGLLKSHAIIAEEALDQSKNNQEITELKNFGEGANKLSKLIDKISYKALENKDGQDSKKTVHKIMSNIGVGLKKLYGGLTAGLSKSVDFIKDLGSKLISAVKSLFEKTPKQQNTEFSSTINDTNKGLNKLGNKTNIAAAKELLKEQFLKLQNDYSKVIPPERQDVFNKWKEIKNAKVDKMPISDL
jgi:hypothetical protein